MFEYLRLIIYCSLSQNNMLCGWDFQNGGLGSCENPLLHKAVKTQAKIVKIKLY